MVEDILVKCFGTPHQELVFDERDDASTFDFDNSAIRLRIGTQVLLGTVQARVAEIDKVMQLVIHAPFGSRINRAWGLALRKRFCGGFGFELEAAATEEALQLSLAPATSFPLGEDFTSLLPRPAWG